MGKILTPVLIFFLLLAACADKDPQLKMTIESDPEYELDGGTPRPAIEMENSVFRVRVATKKGGHCGIESGILHYVQKSTGTDQVAAILDANYMRGPMIRAQITHGNSDSIRVKIEFQDLPDRDSGSGETDNAGSLAYTIYPNSPVLKIEYLERLPQPDPIVDLGAPGGERKIGGGFSAGSETRLHGQESYHNGELVCHPATYWTSVADDPRAVWESGPDGGGALAFKNHLIVAVASASSGEGYGRVVPIHKTGVRGGARHLKLLWNTGIEFYCKPWTDAEFGRSAEIQTESRPFTAYLFCFDDGLDAAIDTGRAIAGGWR